MPRDPANSFTANVIPGFISLVTLINLEKESMCLINRMEKALNFSNCCLDFSTVPYYWDCVKNSSSHVEEGTANLA